MSRLRRAGTGLTVAGALAISTVGIWEGVRIKAYIPIKGDVPTVCFGETRGVKMGDEYTLEECRAMLGDALIEFEAGMRKCLVAPDKIPDRPYVALLSLSYNIGTRAFCGSTVAKRVNAGDIRGACNAIPAWNRAGGKVIPGLVNRRAAERKLCLEGV